MTELVLDIVGIVTTIMAVGAICLVGVVVWAHLTGRLDDEPRFRQGKGGRRKHVPVRHWPRRA